MRKHIICLGDSNTHGYCADPRDCADPALARFNEEERWTSLLQKELGEDYLVTEEGLSGRTTVFEDPLYEGLDALHYLFPCLKSHEPVSLLVIMLGTNDTKERLGANPYAIRLGMHRLVRKAQAIDCWGPGGKPNILILCPPPIGEGLRTCPLYEIVEEMGLSSISKSQALAQEFSLAARELGCHFLDAKTLGAEFNQVDFMHLTKKGHQALAQALAEHIPSML